VFRSDKERSSVGSMAESPLIRSQTHKKIQKTRRARSCIVKMLTTEEIEGTRSVFQCSGVLKSHFAHSALG